MRFMETAWRRSRWLWLDFIAILALSLFLIPLLQPLTLPYLPATHDGHHHLYRLYALDLVVRGGSLWPRWLPDMGFGYGMPVFNYYSPLIYYLGEIMHVFGVGFLDTFRILLALGFILPAWAFYWFSREYLGRSGALVGALLYSYLPYHVGDGYVRGALPEHWAFLFPPLLLWILRYTSQRDRVAGAILGSIALAAFLLLHNLSALLFAPTISVYALGWLAAEYRQLKLDVAVSSSREKLSRYLFVSSLPAYVSVLLLGTGLVAFFVVPGIVELEYIHASRVATKLADYISLLQPGLTHQMFWPWPAPSPELERPFFFVVLGIAGGMLGWRHLCSAQRWHFGFAVSVAALSLFLMSQVSRPLLNVLPQLTFLQFPWRWNAPLTFALAYLAGHVVLWPRLLPESYRRLGQWGTFIIVLGLFWGWMAPFSLPGTLNKPTTVPAGEKILTEEDLHPGILRLYDFQTGLWLRRYGGPWLFEYLPIWAADVRDRWFLPAEDSGVSVVTLSTVPAVQIKQWGALEQLLTVKSDIDFPMRWHIFYFPGWTVEVDGSKVEVFPSTELGLLTAHIPSGSHQVRVYFGTTPVRRIAFWISFSVWVILCLSIVRFRKWRLGIVLLALFVLAGLPLKWRQSNADLIITPQLPKEPWTLVENRGQILGYSVLGAARPGTSIQVNLYWQALQTISENDQVFVALVDQNGKAWTQIDSMPNYGFTPTSRWQPGEIIPDGYRLEIPPDIPPGTYQLRVGMYDPSNLTRRIWKDDKGNMADQIWLGDIQIDQSLP